MNQSVPPAVKLLIQSGVVPENTVRQLISWKLLPENFSSLHGGSPVSLESNWESVEEFVDGLKAALTTEMGSIRETEFDRVGGFREAMLYLPDSPWVHEDVFVDRLGRVLLPAAEPYSRVERLCLAGDPVREIVRREPRYEDKKQVAWVCYLEEEGGHHAH
jgi:hypothetical protein